MTTALNLTDAIDELAEEFRRWKEIGAEVPFSAQRICSANTPQEFHVGLCRGLAAVLKKLREDRS